MNITSFQDLVTPDPRILVFGPRVSENEEGYDDLVRRMRTRVTHIELAENVSELTRQAFERLQLVHMYGLLCYELFTVVDDMSMFTLELALVERFTAFYGGTVPFIVDKGQSKGTELPLDFRSFDDVYRALQRGGSHSDGRVLLKPRSGGKPFRFNGHLGALLRWARAEGLLYGQANRFMEDLYVRMRNHAAHPRGPKLVMPMNATDAIYRTAQIINRLWGSDTPGGRLYPAPIEREIIVLGWEPREGGTKTMFRAEILDHSGLIENWNWIVVRAVFEDQLFEYDSRYETTAFPAELLWGRGYGRRLACGSKGNDRNRMKFNISIGTS